LALSRRSGQRLSHLQSAPPGWSLCEAGTFSELLPTSNTTFTEPVLAADFHGHLPRKARIHSNCQ